MGGEPRLARVEHRSAEHVEYQSRALLAKAQSICRLEDCGTWECAALGVVHRVGGARVERWTASSLRFIPVRRLTNWRTSVRLLFSLVRVTFEYSFDATRGATH